MTIRVSIPQKHNITRKTYNKQADAPAPAPLTISLFYSILLHRKPFLPDHLHHLIHILRTQLITLCLNHHTDHRLRTALTQKDSSILTQSGADPILLRLHTRIAGNRSLVLNLHILQKLWVHLHPPAQRAEALLLLQDHLHQHQCREDSIPGCRMLTENDMSGLLSTEHISVGNHRLIDILIANRGHTYLDALPLHRFEQSHVGHDRGNHRIILQTVTFLQILPTDIQDIIPVHFHTVLIHGNTPVSISVKRKSAIQIPLSDKSLQIFDMCRSTSHIDVGTVRLIANHICFGAKRIKHTLCNIKRTSVGTIQPHAHPIVRSGSQRNQIADVTVPSDRIVPRHTNLVTQCKRQFSHLTIYVFLQCSFHFCGNLVSVSIHDLDSIVIIRIVAGRNHNAAVEIFCTDYICHTRCGSNMQQECICSGCRNTGNQCILKHVTAATCVLSDNDPSPVILVVIPAQVTSNFICMIRSQYFICLTAKTVCSKIFSHISTYIFLYAFIN